MKRRIVAFFRDAESDWVAELVCGHDQHTRHAPPLSERTWVLTPDGRESRVGTPLDCVRCDRSEIPEGYEPYRRTPCFSEETLPDALLGAHATKPGIWGMIHVSRGRLDYHLHAPFDRHEVLTPAAPGVVLPEVEHHVACAEPAEFFVEFLRRGGGGAVGQRRVNRGS